MKQRSFKFFLTYVLFVFVASAIFFVASVNAQTNSNNIYTPIAPLNSSQTNIDVTKGVGDYFNTIINTLIILMSTLAVIMIVIGGIRYMATAIAGEKASAKNQIVNSLLGLVLMLSSYIILNTINPNLVNLTIGIPKAALQAASDTVSITGNLGGQNYSGLAQCPQESGKIPVKISIDGATSTVVQYPLFTGLPWPSDNGVTKTIDQTLIKQLNIFPEWIGHTVQIFGDNSRNQFSSAGISIVTSDGGNSNCDIVGTATSTPCTSVYGLNDYFIDSIINLNDRCSSGSCGFSVTGGTECWFHKSHGPGLDAIDINETGLLINYLFSNKDSYGSRQCVNWPGTSGSSCSGGDATKHWVYHKKITDNGPTAYYLNFYDEGSHFHITQDDVPSGSDTGNNGGPGE